MTTLTVALSRRGVILVLAIGLIAALSAWLGFGFVSKHALVRDAADSMSGVTGTLAGFMLTCISILVALSPDQSKAIGELHRKGSVRRLVRLSGWCVGLLISSSVAAAITRLTDGEALRLACAITAALTATGLAVLVSVGREYLALFGYLSKRPASN
jgi:hypothetical protein